MLLIVISSISFVFAYWADVTIAPDSSENTYTVTTGTWPFYNYVIWGPDTTTYNAGDLVLYTDPNTTLLQLYMCDYPFHMIPPNLQNQ